MFEHYLVEVLSRQFGHLVQGLDRDKVRLSAWRGELVFEDISLKHDALEHWIPECPVEIVHGRVGHLQVQIPWKLLRTQFSLTTSTPKCCVVLTDVNILIAPRRRREERNEEEEGNDQESAHDKEQVVQAALKAQLLNRVAEQYPSSDIPASGSATNNNTPSPAGTSFRWNWLQDRLAQILSNLSVTVRNIHIRYEDPGSCMGFSWSLSEDSIGAKYRQPFAIGLTLKEFSVKTPEGINSKLECVTAKSDDEKETTSITLPDTTNHPSSQEDNSLSLSRRKLVVAERLTAYWDSNCRIMAHTDLTESPHYYQTVFSLLDGNVVDGHGTDTVDHLSDFCHRHSFVLQPFSPSVDITMFQNSNADGDGKATTPPPSMMSVTMPPCRFAVSRNLLEDLGYLRKSLLVWRNSTKRVLKEATLRHLASLRPTVSPLVNPKTWWVYFIEVVLAMQRAEKDHRQKGYYSSSKNLRTVVGWLALTRAVSRRKQYIELYQRLLSDSETIRRQTHLVLLTVEQDLTVDEIVAFRMAAYAAMKTSAEDVNTKFLASQILSTALDESSMSEFSEHNRLKLFVEIARALDTATTSKAEEFVTQGWAETGGQNLPAGLDNPKNLVIWVTKLECSEVSLQVNDRPTLNHGRRESSLPVVRLEFACVLEQALYRDGSWELTTNIGSLLVRDCSDDFAFNKSEPSFFPFLVGPKGGKAMDVDRTLHLNGYAHHQSVRLVLRRSCHSYGSTGEGTTTTTQVRVKPLEIVYSTAPVEALSRILSSAHIELSDGYHHVASRVYEWRERQRQRLLQALAHKEKKMVVDIDVGAPVFLVPENASRHSPLLVIDLGRLQLSSERNVAHVLESQPDSDKWRLSLGNVQIQCSLTNCYRGHSVETPDVVDQSDAIQQLIEPFSLDFAISTATENERGSLVVKVDASMPRLVFNVTSSSVRLIRRLQQQWEKRKLDIELFCSRLKGRQRLSHLGDEAIDLFSMKSTRSPTREPGFGTLEFRFGAPLLRFRFSNDVDGRDCTSNNADSTSIIDVTMRGIEASLFIEQYVSGDPRMKWSARLRSLDALDLYQGAGDDFAYLMSSVSPDLLARDPRHHERSFDDYLVAFAFDSQVEVTGFRDQKRDTEAQVVSSWLPTYSCPRLSVKFHELYVEWNPETLAALHIAMKLPRHQQLARNGSVSSEDDDEFFDAEEEDFYDADSIESDSHEQHVAANVTSSQASLSYNMSAILTPYLRRTSAPHPFHTPLASLAVSDNFPPLSSDHLSERQRLSPNRKPFEFRFELSKLRVHFNKESRHRRLLIAEMDGTSVYHVVKENGVSMSSVMIDNLVFSDADSSYGKTLYREILGLKTDLNKCSSMLQLEMIRTPRSRIYSTGAAYGPGDERVAVNLTTCEVEGYDFFLQARFSPMRFVYLQQLWFESMDYFFEGIVGYEVWGNVRPESLPSTDRPSDAPNADNVTFLKFDICLESPDILVPVTYCSTDYVRLEMAQLSLKNHYNYSDMRLPDGPDNHNSDKRLQWYNNCDIDFKDMRMVSSSSRAWSQNDRPVDARISLNWPTGPSSALNVPKWRIRCRLNALYLSLMQEDYALLQHIVQFNIGEESRHLDEWHALQNMPPLVLERYKQDILVNFGYDKKDVSPATYSLELSVPLVCFRLQQEDSNAYLEVNCDQITWKYRRLQDLISLQSVTCGVGVLYSTKDERISLMSSSAQLSGNMKDATLSYSSTLDPSGDIVKTLDVVDPLIHLDYAAWKCFLAFFSQLPEPSYLSPNDVIQVGDRWYKISGGDNEMTREMSRSRPRLSWIRKSGILTKSTPRRVASRSAATYQFRLRLECPQIRVGPKSSAIVLSARVVRFDHMGAPPFINKDIRISDVQLQTSDEDRSKSGGVSLIEPWSIHGALHRCNDCVTCRCESHSIEIKAEVLSTTAAFSDMAIAMAVAFRFARDMQANDNRDRLNTNEKLASINESPESSSRYPLENSLSVICGGLRLIVVDDSCRHFAATQDIAWLSVEGIEFTRSLKIRPAMDSDWLFGSSGSIPENHMRLRIRSIDLIDRLQSERSPFRVVGTARAVQALLPPEMSNDDGTEIEHYAIELTRSMTNSSCYKARIRSLDLQYNPSMVIALQRFLGRLYKDAKHSFDRIFTANNNESLPAEVTGIASEPSPCQLSLTISVEIDHLSVSLNKEHQGRQMLETTVSDCSIFISEQQSEIEVKGHVGTLDAWDNSILDGSAQNILKVVSDYDNFVEFHYKRFSGDGLPRVFPDWVTSKISAMADDGVNDCLQVSVAALELVIVKEKTAELLDYLSNSMPGRSMGATSRVAKGFVNKRIETKSLLDIHVEAPTIFLPVNGRGGHTGITTRLGDFNLKSWVELDDQDLSRRLLVEVQGLSAGTYKYADSILIEHPCVSEIDLTVSVKKKGSKSIVARVAATDIRTSLHYSDYCVLGDVLRRNIGRKIEKEMWDNLEVAWEEETSKSDLGCTIQFSKEVAYSRSARHVRFGKTLSSSSPDTEKSWELDLRLDCPRVSILLKKDGSEISTNKTASSVVDDLILLTAYGVELWLKRRVDTSTSMTASISRIFMFDVRGMRPGRSSDMQQPNSPGFSVMVEGYSGLSDNQDGLESQVVVTIDSNAAETSISLVVNYLSLALLSGPLEELNFFLTRRWSNCAESGTVSIPETTGMTDEANQHPPKKLHSSKVSGNRLQRIKLVLHYPRFIFVADESDVNSRALVLQGLAMVNATRSARDHTSSVPKFETPTMEIQLHADFQNIYSYINPDVAGSISVNDRHAQVLGEVFYNSSVRDGDEVAELLHDHISHGIPLLLPLTIGIEYEQQVCDQKPTTRTLAVNVDAIAAMISVQDLQLVNSVSKWPARPQTVPTRPQPCTFDVVFKDAVLGLGLRKSGDSIVVDNVGKDSAGRVTSGDVLCAINGLRVPDATQTSLASIVSRLASEPRPLVVTFSRLSGNNEAAKEDETTSGNLGRLDFVNVSISTATLTFMEKEVTLFRGMASEVTAGCRLEQTARRHYQASVSMGVRMDYYNLRAWGWEPLVEQGGFSLSSEFHADSLAGPKELSIEVSDHASGPICINASDAAVESLSKFWTWKGSGKHDDLLAGAFLLEQAVDLEHTHKLAHETVNAALQFAKRQKCDSVKPFVFRNRTGLSLAVVLEKRDCGVKRTPDHDDSAGFITVGEYSGLGLHGSGVVEIANGEEAILNVDVISDVQQDAHYGGRFPRLWVGFQAVADTMLDPLCDLDISRPGEVILPLVSRQRSHGNSDARCSSLGASWLVEQSDEKTSLSLGSSVRLLSTLREALEIGIFVMSSDQDQKEALRTEAVQAGTTSIGWTKEGDALHLPLWLAMHRQSWICCARPSGGYGWTPLLHGSADGSIKLIPRLFLECPSSDPENSDILNFSVSIEEDRDKLTVLIDCSLLLRNLLPVCIDWDVSSTEGHAFSNVYQRIHVASSKEGLCSGSRAEILSKDQGAFEARFRVRGHQAWSNWVSMRLPNGVGDGIKHEGSGFGSLKTQQISIVDEFGVSLFFAVRLVGTRNGIEAVIYSEIWFANCTSLPMVFGSPQNEPQEIIFKTDSSQLTAAESALKEISSLFETGNEGREILSSKHRRACQGKLDILRLPVQTVTSLVEECFEYGEMGPSALKRTWWASENPQSPRPNLTDFKQDGATWQWIDESWAVDRSGQVTREGWESSPTLDEFTAHRRFNVQHTYRRRRWFRRRTGETPGLMLPGVTGFYQPRSDSSNDRERQDSEKRCPGLQVAVQVDGGRWALTSVLPKLGTVHGALRVPRTRWRPPTGPADRQTQPDFDYSLLELCFSCEALEGEWGDFSRIMLVSSRFSVRNDSQVFVFEAKQNGVDDCNSVKIYPGKSVPLHWTDFRLPELICVRPMVLDERGSSVYRWSGGFDPLTIGSTPLRIRKASYAEHSYKNHSQWNVRSVKVESEIRPRTGGTGINLSLQEEDPSGVGALFRVENNSLYPIWIAQDGILANHTAWPGHGCIDSEGEMIKPSTRVSFGLDVPFRQGKYAGRKAATLTELLRARLALAPLSSRAGIETTKVVSLTVTGERIRLNPSKLPVYTPEMRASLSSMRVLGILLNDGPTHVLQFCSMAKADDRLFANPFTDDFLPPTAGTLASDSSAKFSSDLLDAALRTRESIDSLPNEGEAYELITRELLTKYYKSSTSQWVSDLHQKVENPDRDLIVSIRAATQGFVISLIDSAPSEVCVISLANVNALATWNPMQTTNSTIYFTISSIQVDNMVPNAPYPVAVYPLDRICDSKTTPRSPAHYGDTLSESEQAAPVIVIGVAVAPKHETGIVCLRSVTVAPRNLAIKVDLAFLVRLQKFWLDVCRHFSPHDELAEFGNIAVPDIVRRAKELEEAVSSGIDSQKLFFGGLTILPCNIKLSVAPARALSPSQAALEGPEAAAIHQAVRKGDVRLGDSAALLGVKVGSRNATPLAVVRGMFKSIVVDALLRLDGANLNFAGVVLRNHTSTSSQLTTRLVAHYLASLRQNVPALLGSLAAFGNPLGLVRGLGDGVSDFVFEPMKGFQRSVQEMDASHLVDGVARGTLSLARHTVGGIADSAAMLTETFSKNMTVLTLDRSYAQKRDRKDVLREYSDMNVAVGLGSGVEKLATGFIEGVTGVVKAPLRGAEKRGLEGFAKGIGKGLLGLLVKPIIGISDGITDVMIGVKGSVEGSGSPSSHILQVRPRRAFYGSHRVFRTYDTADAAATALMSRTRLSRDNYLSHLDMGNRVALLSTRRLLLLGPSGEELLVVKFKHIESLELRQITQENKSEGWGIIVLLNTPRRNGSDIEVINCADEGQGKALMMQINQGIQLGNQESMELMS